MKPLALVATLAGVLAAAGPVAAQATPPDTTVPILRDSAAALPTLSGDSTREFSYDRIVAVVGDQPILWTDVQEVMYQRRAAGQQIPQDSVAFMRLVSQIVNELIDEGVMVQRATVEKIEVTDDEVTRGVDQQVKRVRDSFKTEQEYRTALRQSGFGTPEEYRRGLVEQAKRQAMMQRLVAKLRQDGKIVPVAVTEQEVTAEFERNKANFPKRPAQVTFRQIIVPPRASEAARATARAKAESLLVEIRRGGNFEQVAKRESMDPGSKDNGGDLGWNRRGNMVPAFDRMMFALQPGQLSPVVETDYGFHIIRVDRVQPAEVKARHILIRPQIDSGDVARARATADTVARQWRAGASFDSLSARYHDKEEQAIIPEPFPRAELPQSYQTAFEGKGVNEVTDPFAIEDPRRGVPKYAVAQITSAVEEGDYTVADLRERIRSDLQERRSIRRFLDGLRGETYVSIRLPALPSGN
jgi:peptidyl-prolyl cis-trans isomerase SurA